MNSPHKHACAETYQTAPLPGAAAPRDKRRVAKPRSRAAVTPPPAERRRQRCIRQHWWRLAALVSCTAVVVVCAWELATATDTVPGALTDATLTTGVMNGAVVFTLAVRYTFNASSKYDATLRAYEGQLDASAASRESLLDTFNYYTQCLTPNITTTACSPMPVHYSRFDPTLNSADATSELPDGPEDVALIAGMVISAAMWVMFSMVLLVEMTVN